MKNSNHKKSSCIIASLAIQLLLLILTLCQNKVNSQPPTNSFNPKVTVDIRNALPWDELLTIHCRSKDDDLGEQILKPSEHFNWTFGINIMQTTLFYCDMSWSKYHGRFDVFRSEPPFLELCDVGGCNITKWEPRGNGIYLYDRRHLAFFPYYQWPTNM
ncbi:hypothetical protein RND81_01G065000 [Saponaria officinalis]|uniref:S-protein homolog n=1 Tax=Saponaria officinalis TaxID=3572 RepID=A0AAW1NGX1_SAPOF